MRRRKDKRENVKARKGRAQVFGAQRHNFESLQVEYSSVFLKKKKKKTEMGQRMDRADFPSPLYSILAMRSWDVTSPLCAPIFKPMGWTRIVVPILTEQQNHPWNFLKLCSSSYLTSTSENCLFILLTISFILGLPSFHNSLIYIYPFHSLSSYPVDFVSLENPE